MFYLFICMFLFNVAFAEEGGHSMVEFNYKVSRISDDQKEKMTGVTWLEGCPVSFEEVRHIELSYIGFDEKSHIGELIVNHRIVDDVVEIFRELYDSKFPIESMKLQSYFNGNDFTSMSKNNTSAFNCRNVPGTDRWSKHSYGVAIDINPVVNPWIENDVILPPEGRPFIDRTVYHKGMIIPGDVCHRAFKSRDWRWGGDFNSGPDYQHFDKMY